MATRRNALNFIHIFGPFWGAYDPVESHMPLHMCVTLTCCLCIIKLYLLKRSHNTENIIHWTNTGELLAQCTFIFSQLFCIKLKAFSF